jgi:hypothetical protein
MGVAGRDDQGSGPGYQPAGIPPKWRRGQPPPPRRSPRRTARSRRSRLRNTRQTPAATEKVRRQDTHWYLANFTPSQPTLGAVTGRGPAGRAADLPGTGPRLGAPTRLVCARDAAITVPCKSAGGPRAAYAPRIGRGPPADPMRTVAHLIVGAQTSAAAMIGGGGAPWAGSESASSAVDAGVRQSVSTLCNELAPLIQVAQGKFKITAISLVLVLGNQMPWSEGFGFAGVARKRAATADTLYRAGSLAKPLTAIAVMRLAESSAIDIDQPLRGYPQEFSIGLRFRTPTDSITVRNALSHQAVLFVTGLMVVGEGVAAGPTVAKLPWSKSCLRSIGPRSRRGGTSVHQRKASIESRGDMILTPWETMSALARASSSLVNPRRAFPSARRGRKRYGRCLRRSW